MKPLKQHLLEIRSGGKAVIREKFSSIFTLLILFIHAFWAIPAVLVIRCIRPWHLIRFGSFDGQRIGTFVNEVCLMWALQPASHENSRDFYWLKSPVSNEFWAKMARRNFTVSTWIRPLDFWNRIIPGGSIHTIQVDVAPDYGIIKDYLEGKQPKMQFLPEEDARAKKWLYRQGWSDGEPIVCLLVRDSSYLDNTYRNTDPRFQKNPALYDSKRGYGWNHLNYRDSDIASYVPAMEWLTHQGAWVIRMGKVMSKPIPSTNPHIIDYAFHEEKDDFLDVWLFAHCDLCITTLTGPDLISDYYRKPLLLLNYLPFWYIFSWSDAMHIPKNLVWKESDKPLTLRELFHYHSEFYDRIGIVVIDLTPDEITSAVKERWQRLRGTWVDSTEEMILHHHFWDIIITHPDFPNTPVHIKSGKINPESRAGTCWLQSKEPSFFD